MPNKKTFQSSLKQLKLKKKKLKIKKRKLEFERKKSITNNENPNHFKDFKELIERSALHNPKEWKTYDYLIF